MNLLLAYKQLEIFSSSVMCVYAKYHNFVQLLPTFLRNCLAKSTWQDWKTRDGQTAVLVNGGKACMESQTVYFTCRLVLNRISERRTSTQYSDVVSFHIYASWYSKLFCGNNSTVMSLKYPLMVGCHLNTP